MTVFPVLHPLKLVKEYGWGLATSMCPLALFLSLPLTPLINNSQISDLRSSARDSERNCNHLQSSMLTTTVMEAILISSILHCICHRRADVSLSVSPLFIREYAIIMDKAFMRRWKVEGGRWTMERNDTLAPQSPPRVLLRISRGPLPLEASILRRLRDYLLIIGYDSYRSMIPRYLVILMIISQLLA